MKKYLLAILIFLSSGMNLYSQVECTVSHAVQINGIWSAWSSWYTDYFYGNCENFAEIGEWRHPSDYRWKLTINKYEIPTKAEIKKHYKNKEWWSYDGILEYCVTDEYPDIESQLKKLGFLYITPWFHDTSKGQTPYVRKMLHVKVKIAPYKDTPRCYNIHFVNQDNEYLSGYGIAIQFESNPFINGRRYGI